QVHTNHSNSSTSLITTHPPPLIPLLFFFNDTAPTYISTLSLHDALPICFSPACLRRSPGCVSFPPYQVATHCSGHHRIAWVLKSRKKSALGSFQLGRLGARS